MLNLISIFCFHGSPGHPDDFVPLQTKLSNTHLVLQNRLANRPDVLSFPPTAAKRFVLGYSWGSRIALSAVAAQKVEAVDGIILVAPFIKANPLSPAKKFLLRIPVLGTLLLKSATKKTVEDFLVKSSSPQNVPAAFRQTAEQHYTTDALKLAVFEKESIRSELKNDLQVIAQSKIPVLLIYGDSDATSDYATHLGPIKNAIPHAQEVVVKDGGHALLWTHTDELVSQIQNFTAAVSK